MGNLKHTIVAAIAIVMISSLATTQTAQFKSAKADAIQAGGAAATSVVIQQPQEEEPKVTAEVWHDTITDDVMKDAAENIIGGVQSDRVGYALVHEGALNVRAEASTDAEVIDQLLGGTKVAILSEGNGWYQIAYGTEGAVGYVVADSITDSYDIAKQAALESSMYETGLAVVGEGALNIRSTASIDAEVIDQIDNGDMVVVIGYEGEWLKVYYGREYKIGYVSAASVNLNGLILREQVQKDINERIAASAIGKGVISISEGAVNVREDAGEDTPVKTQLDNQTNVLVLARGNGWTKIMYGTDNTIGYVKSEYVVDPNVAVSRSSETKQNAQKEEKSEKKTKKSSSTSSAKKAENSAPAKASTKGGSIVAEAEKYLGVKYVYGGTSPSGFDCSGLVQYVLRKQGISVPRSSGAQFGSGVSVSRSELQPGDLVFFKSGGSISHVGIYVGGGRMIHSPRTGKTVCYTSIDSVSRQKSYAGARRVY